MNPAIENLKTNQKQLDADGCMVGVSRQALDETLALMDDLARLSRRLVEHIRDEGPAAKEWEAISAVTDELANLLNIPTE
jgi:hypothetical protein